MLPELNTDLYSASQRAGQPLESTATYAELLTLIADSTDRRVDLAAHYTAAEDVKSRVKLSAELRLWEGASCSNKSRPTFPSPKATPQSRARRAARVRWDRDRAANSARADTGNPQIRDHLIAKCRNEIEREIAASERIGWYDFAAELDRLRDRLLDLQANREVTVYWHELPRDLRPPRYGTMRYTLTGDRLAPAR